MSELFLENLVMDIERIFKKLKVTLLISSFSKLKKNLHEKKLEAKSKKHRTFVLILILQSCENKLSQLKFKTNKQNIVSKDTP